MKFKNPEIAPLPEPGQVDIGGSASDAERFGIPKVPFCEYVREKSTGAIHRWNKRFAKRGDLVEQYDPSLKERIQFKEDIMDLYNRGVTVQNFLDVGVSRDVLVAHGLIAEQPPVQVANTPSPPPPPSTLPLPTK